jgi:hypothetical protein
VRRVAKKNFLPESSGDTESSGGAILIATVGSAAWDIFGSHEDTKMSRLREGYRVHFSLGQTKPPLVKPRFAPSIN